MTEHEAKTNEYGWDTIQNEGIGYAVQHYVSAEVFADSETRRLWKEAADALNALEAHFEALGFEEW